VYAEGHCVSGNASDIVIRAKEKKEQKRLATMEKNKSERGKLIQKLVDVLTKGTNPSNWNVYDLKNMVQWFKIPLDPALPTCRQELIERYKQTKLRTTRGTILPDDSPMPTDSIPALQALTIPMALGLASLMNTMALGLASAIGPAVLAPVHVIAPTVTADVAPTVADDVAPVAASGVTLSAASGVTLSVTTGVTLSTTGKEKKKKQEMLDDECLIVDGSDEEMSDDEFEMQEWVWKWRGFVNNEISHDTASRVVAVCFVRLF
jgi:hypothetical protein